MPGYRPPLRDIDFVLTHVCELEDLARLDGFEHAAPDVVALLLAEAGRFMAETVAPLNQPGDAAGCVRHDDGSVTSPAGFREAYQAYAEAGWGSVPFDPEYGGGGFPWVVGIALQEIASSANLALSLCPLLTQGAIDLITQHGDDAQKAAYLPKLITGEWSGTMCLTEPDAGSDVGALRSRAVLQPDGTYRVHGTKVFITHGEHDLAENIVHLVLARTADAPSGAKGISCFIVPKWLVNADGTRGTRNEVSCASIEHKLGVHASPTCVLSFGDEDGAVAFLVGEENRGMASMFTMMNQARLSVGLQGLAVAERAYQQALAYAQERRQGRAVGAPPGTSSPIVDHPDVRRMLLTMKASVEAMRRLVYWNAAAIDRSQRHPDPVVREDAAELAALLTPLSKAWCTATGIEVASLGIQVHGGVGYCEETGAAQHLRDARITSIYEGTNGIQAVDLVTRKLSLRGGGVIKDHLERIAAIEEQLSGAGDGFQHMRVQLSEALDALTEATLWMEAHAGQPNAVLSGATPYLGLLAQVTAGWLMAASALAAKASLEAGRGDAGFLRSKIATARFFCEQLLPPAVGLVAAATAGAEPVFAVDVDALAD
jgi:alkylation response protein AidB-like acyl-CoA dehydrogenase